MAADTALTAAVLAGGDCRECGARLPGHEDSCSRYRERRKSHCRHRRYSPGRAVPRRHGSWATDVCDDCGAWRTKDHPTVRLDGSPSPPSNVSKWSTKAMPIDEDA